MPESVPDGHGREGETGGAVHDGPSSPGHRALLSDRVASLRGTDPEVAVDVDDRTLLRMRLAAQRVADARPPGVVEAVRHLLALQAQDLRQAEWAIGSRVPGSTVEDVWAAFAAGEIVRSWPMRGTLFALAPADLHLLLALTSDRQIARAAPRNRQLGLTDADRCRAAEAARSVLSGTAADGGLGRAELLDAIGDAGVDVSGQRGAHLIGRLAYQGVLCLGPPHARTPGGPTQGFVLLGEWAPGEAPGNRADALAQLVRRYLTGHGPATERDLAWWSGLTLTEVRAGFAAIREELTEVRCGDAVFWTLGEPLPPEPGGVRALAGFDELLLGYTDRSHGLPAEHVERVVPGQNGIFFPVVVDDGRVVGTWRRVVTRGRAAVDVTPFGEVPDERLAAYEQAAAAVLAFRGEG